MHRFSGEDRPAHADGPIHNPSAAPGEGSGAEAFSPRIWKKDKTYWAPAPPLKLEDLRKIAEAAGVQMYAAAGDQIICDKNLLLIHSASDGQKDIHLPIAYKVTDAFTGEVVTAILDTFSVTLKLGETRLWKTEPVSTH